MNHLETNDKKAAVNTRPLFSSTWLALFNVLRQHYNGETVVTPSRSAQRRTMRESDPSLNLN